MPNFMEISPELAKIAKEITGLDFANKIFFDKPVRIALVNVRSDSNNSKPCKIYYGMNNHLYDSKKTFSSTKEDKVLLIPESEVEPFGTLMFISHEKHHGGVLIGPISTFQRPSEDISPNGDKIDSYLVEIKLRDENVHVFYYATIIAKPEIEILYGPMIYNWNEKLDSHIFEKNNERN